MLTSQYQKHNTKNTTLKTQIKTHTIHKTHNTQNTILKPQYNTKHTPQTQLTTHDLNTQH